MVRPQLNMSSMLAFAATIEYSNTSTLNFLQKNDPTVSHFNWNEVNGWRALIGKKLISNSIHEICRAACYEFVIAQKLLLSLACNGRETLINNLSTDEIQVFKTALLLEKLPDRDVIEWWDKLRLLARNDLNQQLLEQGRTAEDWTINEEKKILSEFTDLLPEFIALDADDYGYDIKSYRQIEDGSIYPIQIEVKSYSSAHYPHFYLSNNEWSQALAAENRYLMYVWCIETKINHKFDIEYLKNHIPENRGSGKWQNILIDGI